MLRQMFVVRLVGQLRRGNDKKVVPEFADLVMEGVIFTDELCKVRLLFPLRPY